MASKSSQQASSLGSNQPQPFQAAVTKLCALIDKAKEEDGEIRYVQYTFGLGAADFGRADAIVAKLKGFVKGFRGAGKLIQAAVIAELLVLDNDGANLCARLAPAVFCIIAELVMQSEPSLQGDRVLVLLAVSREYNTSSSLMLTTEAISLQRPPAPRGRCRIRDAYERHWSGLPR